jgi:hypothetical protein
MRAAITLVIMIRLLRWMDTHMNEKQFGKVRYLVYRRVEDLLL